MNIAITNTGKPASLIITVATALLLLLSAAANAASPELPPLKVDGSRILANGQPIHLRGIDWGWWHLKGTRYSEADMQNVARWGANVIRLSFSYSDLPADDPAAFKEFDDVVQWAQRCGVYVILDMHVVPGGQSFASYCAGGRNLIWTDAASQERFLSLWTQIARRYRNHPEVAAYELMNEPDSAQKTPQLLHQVCQRAIDAIRSVDPDKIIVVGGDKGYNNRALGSELLFPDKNILYTIHWYIGAGGNEDWISTERLSPGLSGTQDWAKLDKTFTAPAGADHMSVVLRSIGNSALAWFDDVQVTDASGATLEQDRFDHDAQGFHPEAFPDTMSFDPATGHGQPGSLKVHGLNKWAGWMSKRLVIQPGGQYRISAWAKTQNATGDTYLAAMFFRTNTQLDPQEFQKRINPAVEFSRQFNVPVWVGEFGCDASNPQRQLQWVDACITLFENNGLHWTYWNHRETTNPTSMALHPQHRDGTDYPVNENLLAALRRGWRQNGPTAQGPGTSAR
jgi:endoglucanase